MIRFAEAYQDETIVSTLPGQLSWSQFLNLISIDEPLKRDFFTRRCAGWTDGVSGCCGQNSGGSP